MNSQSNRYFAEIKREDRGGNSRVGIESLLSVSVFFREPPNRPRTPTLAHVGRPAGWWTGFTSQGMAATWAKPVFFVKKPRI